MFHWSIFTTSDATHFVLTVPMHYIGLLLTLPWILWPTIAGWKPGHAMRNYVWCAIVLVAASFFTYSSQLTLDRASNTATLREFEFFHWVTRTYPLDHIDHVYVATGTANSQLRMQFTSGHTHSLTYMDQYGGKDEMAYKANAFLGTLDNQQ